MGSGERAAFIRQQSAVIPIAMSLAALGVIAVHLAVAGTAPQADEGLEAHLWQLLMVGQLPIVAFFAITTLPRKPRQAWLVLLVQAVAGIAAVAPIFLLNW